MGLMLPGETEKTVAAFRMPLDEKNAGRLAEALVDFPSHSLRVVGSFVLVQDES